MTIFRFNGLLQNTGWVTPAFIQTDSKGLIKKISNQPPQDSGKIEKVDGFALPGFQNAHSHAFQYAMAGIAESYSSDHPSDDFWKWRKTMYQLALSIQPDDLEDIAAMLYAEMLRNGYTQVAEFHYLHHDPNGMKYDHLAEMGERLISAAQKTGIKITLVPIFYQMGGFGQAPGEQQRRFISSTPEDYFLLMEANEQLVKNQINTKLGWGIHSLRAAKPSSIKEVLKCLPQNTPFHIHVAEQNKEVSDAEAFLKTRPVQWVLDHMNPNENFHLVHATHLSEEEIKGISKAGCHVVLCPSTEGNLGDGLFPLRKFMDYGGKWSIGTDSHIGLSPMEELRLLDYGQRLVTHHRNTFCDDKHEDSGTHAINMATNSGRMAMGNSQKPFFAVGDPFDAAVIDATHPLILQTSLTNLISSFIYGCGESALKGTIVNGTWVVKEGKHIRKDALKESYINTLKKIRIR